MKIAIIGAGLSGVTAAKKLQTELGEHVEICLFEKSRGAGGRMSTRRTDDFEFDHGAQYFTAKDSVFKSAVDAAIKDGFVAPWPSNGQYLKDGEFEKDLGGKRYVSTPRMNSWIKSLAEDLHISTNARVETLSQITDTQGPPLWRLTFEGGKVVDGFNYVIAAIPAPQAEALLSPLGFEGSSAIMDARMDPCFAVMAGFKETLSLPWDSLRREDGPASWIAVNSAKPGRPPTGTTLMIHSGPNWSHDNVDRDKTDLQSEILSDVTKTLGIDFKRADYVTIHRWLYAAVSKGAEKDCLADENLGVITCGDWCLGGRVEGAYLSGIAAANKTKIWIQNR